MKKLHLLGILPLGVLLSACGSNQVVQVAKGTDQSIIHQTVVKQVDIPMNLPSNVTAICQDSSYSTASINICAGNGGVRTIISRHYSE